jgi:SAM-dependent methyltransferase
MPAQDPNARTRAFYDSLADTYDLIYADWDASIRRQAESLDAILTAAGVPRAAAVLDCACGIGTQALGLAALGRPLTGTDSSCRAVRRARETARRRSLSILLAAADLRALPFPDGTFAAVVCADNSLPHLVDPSDLAAGLAEIARVLRPGGTLVASTRDYDADRHVRPGSAAPSVRTTPTGRVITFQLWHWHDDGERYDLEHFQLEESGHADWRVHRRTTTYWALTREQLNRASSTAGFTSSDWYDPEQTGFFQPVLVAKRT